MMSQHDLMRYCARVMIVVIMVAVPQIPLLLNELFQLRRIIYYNNNITPDYDKEQIRQNPHRRLKYPKDDTTLITLSVQLLTPC